MKEIFVYKEFDQIKNKDQVRRFFDSMPNGKNLLTQKKANKRTLQQNDWFHAVLPDILAGLRNNGYQELRTLDQAKAFIKELFFKIDVSNGTNTVSIVQPTSETTKEDFTGRADEMIIWANEYLGIDIAPPNTQITMYQ